MPQLEHEPSDPNALYTAGKDTAELGEGFDREVFLRDSRNEDGLRLGQSGVLAGHKEVLAQDDVRGQLALDEVESVNW